LNRYICQQCGSASYSAASPETVKPKCLNPGCGGKVVPDGPARGTAAESRTNKHGHIYLHTPRCNTPKKRNRRAESET
jgi:hypothetical protein